MTHRWTAQELLDLVLDEGSFESWDEPIDISDAPDDYRAELEAAREKAGTDESVLTGSAAPHAPDGRRPRLRPMSAARRAPRPTLAM
jgi:acetyl-CoA carboxylase carboxyl transferase subunit beta